MDGHEITASVTPQDDQEQQNPQDTIALPRRSNRIAYRRARSLQQQAAQDQNASSDQNNAAMPSTSNEIGDAVGNCITNDNTNPQEIPNSLNQIDDFKQWSQNMQCNPVEVNYDEMADEIAEIVNKPKITIGDYLADTYFAAIYQYLKNDKLPADDKKARKILLIFENYYIENHLLYKVSLPRGKKEQKVKLHDYQLCIPESHTTSFLNEWHRILGHFSANKLIPTLANRYFWPRILQNKKMSFVIAIFVRNQ